MTTDFIKAPQTVPQSALRDVGLHEQITAIRHHSVHVSGDLSTSEFYAIDKLEAHIENVRHVAVSIFIFHEDKLLLQRRAETKYHSAGLWANTVCSHPRWNETADDCAHRRLGEELGWNVPLFAFGSIDYSARVGDLFENEYVHCFYGKHNEINDISRFNKIEVDAVDWVTVPEVMRRIAEKPESFTEWFKIYMSNHRDMIESVL